MSYLTDRRRFLKSTALTGVGVFVAGKAAADDSKSPNEPHSFRLHRRRRQGRQ